MKGGCYRRNNRAFRIIYVVITSMIAGLPLWFASSPRFSASWSFSGSVTFRSRCRSSRIRRYLSPRRKYAKLKFFSLRLSAFAGENTSLIATALSHQAVKDPRVVLDDLSVHLRADAATFP